MPSAMVVTRSWTPRLGSAKGAKYQAEDLAVASEARPHGGRRAGWEGSGLEREASGGGIDAAGVGDVGAVETSNRGIDGGMGRASSSSSLEGARGYWLSRRLDLVSARRS